MLIKPSHYDAEGYVIQWWNLRLTRERGTIRLTSGAFTTRSTSVEEAKVRGVEMIELGVDDRVLGNESVSNLHVVLPRSFQFIGA